MKRFTLALFVVHSALAHSGSTENVHREAPVVKTGFKTYEDFVPLIKRPAPGEDTFAFVPDGEAGSIENAGKPAQKTSAALQGKALIELFGNEEIVEISAWGDLSDREIYDVVYAGKITAENLLLRFHIAPRGRFILTTASNRFLVSVFHGAPIGSVRPDNEPELWFWRKDNPP